jgi:uncharacterized protein (DUF849 family)
MRKVIIEVRGNERAMRDVNPNVPWTPAELAANARACVDAGAAVIHFHARADDGASVEDYALYRDTVARMRSACDALIHPSLGANALHPEAGERFGVVWKLAADGLLPDLAPVGMAPSVWSAAPESEILSREGAEDELRATIRDAVGLLTDAGVIPYLDIWHVDAMRRTAALLGEGLVSGPAMMMVSMATEAAGDDRRVANGERVTAYEDLLAADPPHNWSALCGGGNLLPMIPRIVEAGGNLSIGIGDYPYAELGLPTNAALVGEVVRFLRSLGCEPASPAEARELLGLPARQPAAAGL